MDRPPKGEPEQSVLPMHEGRVRLSCTWKADPEAPEMIEEYQLAKKGEKPPSGQPPRVANLLLRKWRKSDRLNGPGPWTIEFGSAPAAPPSSGAASQVRVNAANPIWHSRDSALFWEWAVTNIPYPPDTYSVTVGVLSLLSLVVGAALTLCITLCVAIFNYPLRGRCFI